MLRRSFLLATVASMFSIAGCGDMSSLTQRGPTLAQYDKIKQGMNEAQVTAVMGKPSKRMLVQGGEGGGERQMIMRWVSTNQIITVTLGSAGVVGKEKI